MPIRCINTSFMLGDATPVWVEHLRHTSSRIIGITAHMLQAHMLKYSTNTRDAVAFSVGLVTCAIEMLKR